MNLVDSMKKSALLKTRKRQLAVAFLAVATLSMVGCKVKEKKETPETTGVVAALGDAADGAAVVPVDNTLPFELNVGALPMKGNPKAKVTLVQYSDFECPFCSRVEPTVDQILKDYPDDVRVVFVNYPLDSHANAKPAAKAALAAHKQGKFWEMHKEVFDNNKKLSDSLYKELAAKLGLDVAKFEEDMKDPGLDKVIADGMASAARYDISGTPSFLINGVKLVGAQPIDAFKKAIDAEIKRADEVAAAKSLSGEALYHDLVRNAPKAAPPKAAAPEEPAGRVLVDLANSPVLGDANAPVTLIEFTDYECPFCARANNTIKELVEKNPGKVKVVFKHNPLNFHKKAKLAHKAAQAAAFQGKFWEYNDLVFANRGDLSREKLIAHAKELGLDEAKFVADMDSEETTKLVDADLAEGAKASVRGTPHFFLNGTRFSGAQPLPAFQAALDKEIAFAEELIKKGISADKIYEEAAKAEPVAAPKPAAAPELDTVAIPINVDGAPFKGAADAPVVIVQYSEFQCPFCSRVEPTLEQLLKDYDGKIKIAFKHLPLPFHNNAKGAAEASMAANAQGKFWEMHKLLFENQDKLDRENLNAFAEQIGLDMKKFAEDMDNNAFAAIVEANAEEAGKAGISGTPSFIINGKLLVGAQPITSFKSAIDAALAEVEKK
ncbi:MAG: thioredoxin domain-containing protein [Bradymonadales bacterium]|jgi:protein-disulfide isomerase